MHLKYRTDIDGLRAIAVLSVIFFHFNIGGFSGGFVGVDVFFVISGFLITSSILKEIKDDKFSIARFYERRIRRIFPALFPVIILTLLVGAYLFDYRAFKDLGKSITATTLFASNILFWKESGYFSAPSLQKPLLHTWSLAVEEQFYIFFPLFLIAAHRFFRGHIYSWIAGVGIASLLASIWGVYTNPSATFYLVPFRAWELLAGSILATEAITPCQSLFKRNILSVTGLLLVGYSVLFFTESSLFPGYNALIPVLGSTLIIYSGIGGSSQVSKMLSLKPIVFIGGISYSLYLWHWPLIAFTKYLLFRDLYAIEVIGLIAATFLVSTLSWKFVEQPFRCKKSIIPDRNSLFAYSGIVMFVTIIIGSMIYQQNGMPYRSEVNFAIMKVENDSEWQKNVKDEKIVDKLGKGELPLLIGKQESKPSFLLWGDSHARALIPAISDNATQNHLSGFVITHTSCPPLLGINIIDTPFNEEKYNRVIIDFIQKHPEIKTVFLAGRWAAYAAGDYKQSQFSVKLEENNEVNSRKESNAEITRKGVTNTVKALLSMHRKVVIISQVPEIGYDVLRIYWLFKTGHLQPEGLVALLPDKSDYQERNKDVNKMLSELSLCHNVTVISPASLMFNNGRVSILQNNKIMYRDTDHLSTDGSHFVSTVFNNYFNGMAVKIAIKNNRGI